MSSRPGRTVLLPRAVAVLAVLALAMSAGCMDRLGELKNERTQAGDNARDYLGAKYDRIVVEVDYVNGAEPNAEAMRELETQLEAVSGKPVTVVKTGGISQRSPSAKYTFKEIEAIEKEHRDYYTGGDTAALYMLYVDGGSSEDKGDSKTLGAAYRGSSLVMFKGNIRDSTRSDGSLPLSTRPEERCVERAVAVHEVGHALGLVNNGIPMVKDHEDKAHPKHSASKQSVMYWAVENTLNLFTVFTGGCSDIPYKFDADDKADMKAVREE